MAQDEVLRMVAAARDNASGPLRKVEGALRGVGKQGTEQSKQLRESFRTVHEQFGKVAEVAREGVSPAIDAIGVSSFSAVGAVAALVAGLKSFVGEGSNVAAFGRKVQLTTDTIRGLEGVAEKFHVDPGEIRSGEATFSEAMYQVRRRRGELFAHLLAQRRDVAEEIASTPETAAGNEQALRTFLKLLEDVKRVHGAPTARAFSKEVFGTDAFVDLLSKGNAGLEEAIQLTLKLRGNMDTAAADRWVENWSDFKAAIEGVRNEVGNDLLPDLTELAKQAQAFFSEHKVEIGREIASTTREIASALHGINTGVQAVGGWKVVFEGLIALKLAGLASRILAVAAALRTATVAFAATPVGALAALIATIYPQPAGSADEKAQLDAGIAAARATGATNQREAAERAAAASSSGPGVGNATSIIQGLRDRGLDAMHAAILGGNIEQESGFDASRPNVAEGGIGLIQWRKERRAALQAFAAKRHTLETDAATQLDFLMKELGETPQGRAFLEAQTEQGANASLHSFIRYGDDSEGRRLANGRALRPLAEKSGPGSLLSSAGQLPGWASTVMGSASLKVDVTAPPSTRVRADADGMFKSVEVNRGLSMPRASEQD